MKMTSLLLFAAMMLLSVFSFGQKEAIPCITPTWMSSPLLISEEGNTVCFLMNFTYLAKGDIQIANSKTICYNKENCRLEFDADFPTPPSFCKRFYTGTIVIDGFHPDPCPE